MTYLTWSDRPKMVITNEDIEMALEAYRYSMNHRFGEEIAMRAAVESVFILKGYGIVHQEEDTSPSDTPPSP